MHVRKDVAEGAAVAAAAVAVAVTYGIYAVHPWQGSTPLNQFLAAFGRADTTAWDRASGPAWHTVAAGLLFALMIAWSGHDTVLIGLAVVLLAVMLARAITSHRRPPHADPVPRPGRAS